MFALNVTHLPMMEFRRCLVGVEMPGMLSNRSSDVIVNSSTSLEFQLRKPTCIGSIHKQPKWFDSVYLLDCIKGLWLQPCTVTSSAEHASATLG